jgi:selenocysteine lyase/cysteine desulfurase
MLTPVDVAKLRHEFPMLEEIAYLNAGTDGPLAARSVSAAEQELRRELEHGRWRTHFERRKELGDRLRGAYAALLGTDAANVALTTSTSEGISHVIAGVDLQPGDEIVTSDEEHPGLLGALKAAQDLSGASIRTVALAEVARAVGPRTRLVACCHVGWMSGSLAPGELAGLDVPVLLDGAQGVGAVPIDLDALGCDAYAGSGQKWLCGPDGTGMLYLDGRFAERLSVPRRGYPNLRDPDAGLEAQVHEDARRFDALGLSAEAVACALGSLDALERTGWDAIHDRARSLAAELADRLQRAGREVAPRASTTLVSFWSPDPEGERERLAQVGVILRDIPGRPWLRASVGAWNDERDLERLLEVIAS